MRFTFLPPSVGKALVHIEKMVGSGMDCAALNDLGRRLKDIEALRRARKLECLAGLGGGKRSGKSESDYVTAAKAPELLAADPGWFDRNPRLFRAAEGGFGLYRRSKLQAAKRMLIAADKWVGRKAKGVTSVDRPGQNANVN